MLLTLLLTLLTEVKFSVLDLMKTFDSPALLIKCHHQLGIYLHAVLKFTGSLLSQ